ncbi:MAG: TIM barrel protein [Propionibacteriaceae bacterium]|nr:TIM barrel protein [Propionibacteriaceae bacterium]
MTKDVYAVNCSILLTDLPLLERPAAAKAAGFDNAELWWPFGSPVPDATEIAAFAKAFQDAGVHLTGLNLVDEMPAERGLISLPARVADLRANLDAVTRIAEATGCRKFNALYGLRKPGSTPAEQDEVALANLAAAAQAVARIGGTILLEPISGAPDYPLKSAQAVVEVLDRVGEPNIGLLLDVYHLTMNGDDVDAAIERYGDRVAHVQIADAPGRGAPGSGELPIQRWMEDVYARGYDGLIGLEYVDKGPTPFAWAD